MSIVMRDTSSSAPPEELTKLVRSELGKVEGKLFSWMPPEFWSVELDIMQTPSTPNMRIDPNATTLVPTALVGRKIEFFPVSDGFKVVTGDLFVNAPSTVEGIIALARLVAAKGA